MASQYDFKNLERDISSLEKDLSKFQDKFDETVNPILKASFNEREYGSREIERKIEKMVNGTKKDINSLFSGLINEIRRTIHSSEEKIKEKANEVISYVNDLNSTINTLNDINRAYASENYKGVIDQCDSLGDSFGNSKMQDYIKLSKIMAYDKFCSEGLKTFDPNTYYYYTSYYSNCKRYSAINHMGSACEYLFIASCIKIESCLSALDKDEAYSICNNAAECYRNFDSSLKNKYQSMYAEVYKVAVSLFNEKSEKAYNSFDYLNVVNLLVDSKNYHSSDIKIDFFKDSSCNEEKMFSYVKSFGSRGSIGDRKSALLGTISLAKAEKREAFIEYWISTYDDNDWSFIDEIIKVQDDRFYANSLVSDAIQQNAGYIRKKGDLCLNLAKDYYAFLEEISGNISLDDFTDSAITLNALVNAVKKNNYADGDDSKLKEAISIIDGLNYGMIVKHQKMCNLYKDHKISDLNRVLDDASLRLYGKKYRKDLKHDVSKQAVERTNALVKLSTAASQSKNKKLLIIAGVAVAIIAIAIIIAIVIPK